MPELQGDVEHIQAVHGHPGGPVGLIDVTSGGEGFAPVEDADVVETQETALEDVVPVVVLAVDPPGEVQEQLVEDTLQEFGVGHPADGVLQVIDAPGGPGVDGRVDVGEVPFIRRDLAVGVLIPLTQEERQLVLGEVRVDHRHRHHMKAVSHAAYHGYSHLSGIERISTL